MAGIYLHIPFCKQACHYCNFHFSTSLKLQNDFLQALLKELEIRKEYLGGEPVNTIYFGGGTPSLLPALEIGRIMETIHGHFNVSAEAEVTLEANPDDISVPSMREWRNYGINRLSVGIQSFFEEDLLWMNRAHNSQQARRCIPLALDSGFTNMSIDLIYGGPTLPDDRWRENLLSAVNFGVPHLSCYALTVEPGTALDSMIRKKKVAMVENEDQARQFLIMTDFLQHEGYLHYEISNFALPGMKSMHNSSYWSGAKYLGLGPSAHSFDGTSRQWNIANNALYVQSLKNDTVSFEMETLTPIQRYNEYVMTSLRTMEGVSISQLKSFDAEFAHETLQEAERFRAKGWLVMTGDRLVLTREGKLFADGIASELFIAESHQH